MVDITTKLFWYRTKEWYAVMADKLKEFVYTDKSKETLDVINLLLLGWILLGLIVYIVGTIVATYIRKRKSRLIEQPNDEIPSAPHVELEKDVQCENDLQQEVLPVAKREFQIPVCEGEDEEFVEWINNVLGWIFSQGVVSPVIDAWLSALNARTRLSSTEHGILVDFKTLHHTCSPPEISELRQSSHQDLNCQIVLTDAAFDVTVTQFKDQDKIVIPFTLNVERLAGSLDIECNPDDVSCVARFAESPQIQSSSVSSNSVELSEAEHQTLCDLVCEITSDALSTSTVPLRFSRFPACPRPLPHYTEDVFEETRKESEKQLLVKIIKANNLGGDRGCCRPYCIVEMDDPPQKFETQVVEGTQSPFWDEAFTFSVKGAAELLFEIYDKDKPASESFLGLGIVGLDELIKNPSQRQILPLQSRPLEDDHVTGALTVEFLFLNQSSPVTETTHLSQWKCDDGGNTVETNCRVTSGGTLITTTTIKRTDAEADLSSTALKEIERHATIPSVPSKSTLIIHSVQRPDIPSPDSLNASPRSYLSNSVESTPSPITNGEERSRPKEKRNLFGSLRRKLSFSKNRSKSTENRSAHDTASNYSGRSASSDRRNKLSPFKAKLLGQYLTVPAGSTRSSLSEASGVSGRTYINENSTLVIETNENGIVKRYLIPNSVAHRSKWLKKRGTKLHIYNDHVFIARHLTGSTQCQVCKKYLTRRPGKQGYECRGCHLQCHKSCHVRVEGYCSDSSINSMEVEYVQDPKGASPKSI